MTNAADTDANTEEGAAYDSQRLGSNIHELSFDDDTRPKDGLIRKETMRKLHENSVNLGAGGAL